MTRRRLGATIPADARLRAYELRLRELTRHAETLAAAAERLDRSPLNVALEGELIAGVGRLEAIAHRPFRRPRPALERPAPGLRQLRTFDA